MPPGHRAAKQNAETAMTFWVVAVLAFCSSAGSGAGLAAGAGGGGGLFSGEPAGLPEFEGGSLQGNGMPKLRGAGILRQNSGKGCFLIAACIIEIIHDKFLSFEPWFSCFREYYIRMARGLLDAFLP